MNLILQFTSLLLSAAYLSVPIAQKSYVNLEL